MINSSQKKYFIATLFSLGLLIGFSLLVKMNFFSSIDFKETIAIQNHIPRRLDRLFSYLSLMGSFEITTTILFLLLIWRRSILRGAVVFVMYTLGHVIEIIGKAFLYHPSPPFKFFRYDLGFSFPSSSIQTGSSYPSGHSFRMVFIAWMIYILLIRRNKVFGLKELFLTTGLIIFTGAMLISRISLGEHWASDVIGGTLLGVTCGLTVNTVVPSHSVA